MTTDFNFYLNTQGIRGKKGDKGDTGFSPSITVGQNTLNTFTLLITTTDGTFETPNLRGSVISGAGVGTFLAYNQSTDSIYLTDLPIATPEAAGIARLASDEELASGSGDGVVTVSDLDDFVSSNLYDYLIAGDNIQLSVDSETGKVTISAVTGPDDHEQVVQNTADIADLQENKEDKFTAASPLVKSSVNQGVVRTFTYNATNNTITTDGIASTVKTTYNNFDAILAGTRGIFSPYRIGDIIKVPRDWGVAFGKNNTDSTFTVFTSISPSGDSYCITLPNNRTSNIGCINTGYWNSSQGGTDPRPSFPTDFGTYLDPSNKDYKIIQLFKQADHILKVSQSGDIFLGYSYPTIGSRYHTINDTGLVYTIDDIDTVVMFPATTDLTPIDSRIFKIVDVNNTDITTGNVSFEDIENASNLLDLGASYTTHFLGVNTATTDNFGVVKPDGTTITISNGVISSVSTGGVSSVNGQTGAVVLTASDVDALPDSTVIPTVNDVTITFTQGGVTKGSFTTNQSSGSTIALDASGGSSIEVYYE